MTQDNLQIELNIVPTKKVEHKKKSSPKQELLTRLLKNVDILESDLRGMGEKANVLDMLLMDQSKSIHTIKRSGSKYDASIITEPHHIIWATDNYKQRGTGYLSTDEISVPSICLRKRIIQPRSVKAKSVQAKRTKDKAEVFTPSWICNMQNNIVDSVWFNSKNIFNIENKDHTWEATKEKINFPEGKTWHEYISERRIEITCGEAPYLVSRYDTTTGDFIPVRDKNNCFQRIGLLDRKFRVIAENVKDIEHWRDAAYKALKSIYGFEWQGDNLILARENIFVSFIEYYYDFCRQLKIKEPQPLLGTSLYHAAYIISWNIFQMDGIKYILPYSDQKAEIDPTKLPFEDENETNKAEGILAQIAQWGGDGRQKYMLQPPINFRDLIN